MAIDGFLVGKILDQAICGEGCCEISLGGFVVGQTFSYPSAAPRSVPSDGISLRVQNLGKCYDIYESPRDRLKQFILPRLQRAGRAEIREYFTRFWALDGVSFELRRGETIGILGRNGSGKSTLLQIICGTLSPTAGVVEVRGRIAGLLELGSGFNAEFTGMENVFLSAAVLGLDRGEIERRLDDILSFADIGEFIHRQLKTYSSGMALRLAFAVYSQIEPDVLVIDEALAVGDARFQSKCFERLRQLKDGGTSILLVSHSTEQIVSHCTRAILLDQGAQIADGEPRSIVNRYLDLLFGKGRTPSPESDRSLSADSSNYAEGEGIALSADEDLFRSRAGYNPNEYRWGDGDAQILDFFLEADRCTYPSAIRSGAKVRLVVSIRFKRDFVRPILGITVKTKEGVTVCGANTESLDFRRFGTVGRNGLACRVEAGFVCRLAAGSYFVSLGVASMLGEEAVPHDRRYDAIHFDVLPSPAFFGLADLDMEIKDLEVIA